MMHFSYERYLENQLRAAFGFEGTTIRLQFRARTTTRNDEDEQRGGRKAGRTSAKKR